MERRKPVPSPLEQLQQVSEGAEETWRILADHLLGATLELIEVNDEEKMLLQESFWSVHPQLLAREEKVRPGISEQVFIRFEQIATEYRKFEMIQFEEETLPAVKREARKSAFLREMIGLPPKYPEV